MIHRQSIRRALCAAIALFTLLAGLGLTTRPASAELAPGPINPYNPYGPTDPARSGWAGNDWIVGQYRDCGYLITTLQNLGGRAYLGTHGSIWHYNTFSDCSLPSYVAPNVLMVREDLQKMNYALGVWETVNYGPNVFANIPTPTVGGNSPQNHSVDTGWNVDAAWTWGPGVYRICGNVMQWRGATLQQVWRCSGGVGFGPDYPVAAGLIA